jgi:molecular chaperone DnaK
MPMVQKAVTEFFGKEARKDINPDEAVALGAATQGAVLSGERSDVLLLDVTPLTLGIETLGGVLTPMIEKNTTIPTNKSQVYSTAEDNQTAVTVHVLQGERKKASDNKSLGQFNLTDIPAAPRGTPQIEVTFDIDANGIINVSAKDKSTNVEQSITIQGGSGLSDEEIEKMVKDAELNAEEDKKFEELIASRNMADGLASSTKKAMEENKDELTEDESKSLGEAISNVEEACKSESKEDIDKAVEELSKIAQPLSDKLFKKEAPEQTTEESSDDKPEDAVDAEFKEVDDEKDK